MIWHHDDAAGRAPVASSSSQSLARANDRPTVGVVVVAHVCPVLREFADLGQFRNETTEEGTLLCVSYTIVQYHFCRTALHDCHLPIVLYLHTCTHTYIHSCRDATPRTAACICGIPTTHAGVRRRAHQWENAKSHGTTTATRVELAPVLHTPLLYTCYVLYP